MSSWTHITACLSVETGALDHDIVDRVRGYIALGPKITGSEQDADIFVNLPSGFNFYTSCDCQNCKYKDTIKWIGKGEFECDRPFEDERCPEGEYQTCVVISIQGDLRDRTIAETDEEFNTFFEYITKKYHVRDYSINIDGDY
jgi:hypothetical protein